MTLTSTESKQFVGRYLQALSGQAKTPELVASFVSDRALAEHIQQVEAAFPAYERIADELIAAATRLRRDTGQSLTACAGATTIGLRKSHWGCDGAT